MGKRVVLSNIVSRLSVLPVRISARRVVILGLVAGYIDALSFVDLGGIFAGAMTGNTTHMGALFIDGHWQHALLRMSVLIIFLGMAILASLIRLLCSSLYVIGLAIVLMLFAQLAYGSFYWRYVGELIILPALLAIQGAAFTRFSGTPMPTIVVTTNLLKAASGVAGVIASRLLPEKNASSFSGEYSFTHAFVVFVFDRGYAWRGYFSHTKHISFFITSAFFSVFILGCVHSRTRRSKRRVMSRKKRSVIFFKKKGNKTKIRIKKLALKTNLI